jgi:hypothetical protein
MNDVQISPACMKRRATGPEAERFQKCSKKRCLDPKSPQIKPKHTFVIKAPRTSATNGNAPDATQPSAPRQAQRFSRTPQHAPSQGQPTPGRLHQRPKQGAFSTRRGTPKSMLTPCAGDRFRVCVRAPAMRSSVASTLERSSPCSVCRSPRCRWGIWAGLPCHHCTFGRTPSYRSAASRTSRYFLPGGSV